MGRWTRGILRLAVNAAAVAVVAGTLERRRSRGTAAAPGGDPRREGGRAEGDPAERSGPAADVSDDGLVARVRAEVRIPKGVEVATVDGAVVLFGRLPPFAIEPLLQRVARVEGVSVVENRLTPAHDLHHA